MERFGFPPAILRLMDNLYDNLQKSVKIGKSLGKPRHNANGYGHGGPLSLLPALSFVSVQFTMIHKRWPDVILATSTCQRYRISSNIYNIAEARDAIRIP